MDYFDKSIKVIEECYEAQEKENKLLRKLLWLRHGCAVSSLYGDDGEMQCQGCGIDFKRDPAEKIHERMLYIGRAKLRQGESNPSTTM